jgi:ubiquinone/menaquinone biosynthesis C-methylase UbiE
MPAMSPKPGELWVQETFTDEWDVVDVEDSEFNFIYTLDDLISPNKRVWLKWLYASNEDLTSVLDVGCGIGVESVALSKVIGSAEIFAIDLNLSLMKSGKVLAQNPRIHLVISSLFDIPFRESSFDLVYSQGVLHHTFCDLTPKNRTSIN